MNKRNKKRNIKRLLLLVTGLISVFILVLLVNTFRFKSKQIQIAPVAKMDIPEDAIMHLSQSIQFETISNANTALFDSIPFLKFCDFLVRTYPQIHATLERKLINNYSLLYKWKGKSADKKPIILTAHYDVVPVEESSRNQWQENPFSGKIDDSFIWGRGTMDDKIGVIGIMETIERLLTEGFIPEQTIYLAFGHDEEISGLNGAKMIVEYLKSNHVTADFVLDEGLVITRKLVPGIEEDVALIGLSEKGYLSVDLSINHPGGHSSMPDNENTIDILAKAIVKLQENQLKSKICEPTERFFEFIGPEMPSVQKFAFANRWLFESIILKKLESSPTTNSQVRTTTAPTIFQSGLKDNILPTSAIATVNFRILPGETVDDILAHVKNVIDDERIIISPENSYNNPSPVSSTESLGFQTIHQTIKQIFPDVLVSASLVNGGTDSRHYASISNNVYRFLPVTETSEDLSRNHGVNERISIEAFKECCRFYYQLMKNTNQLSL